VATQFYLLKMLSLLLLYGPYLLLAGIARMLFDGANIAWLWFEVPPSSGKI